MKEIIIKNPKLIRQLNDQSNRLGQNPTSLAEEILEKGLSAESAIEKLEHLREKMIPQAKAAGFNDEETILREIS